MATLQRGDLMLTDRYYGGWFMLALLRALGVEFVTQLHQHRTAEFTRGKRLSQGDHLVAWPRQQKPEWLDQETYDRLPERLEVCETEVRVNVPGFRTESLVVVTLLFDHKVDTRTDISMLDRRRWVIELELRDIKTTMRLDILRRTRPERVRQELWTGLLAYNFIRQSALASARRPHSLSFAASLQLLANTWVLASRVGDRQHPPLATARIVSNPAWSNADPHRWPCSPNSVPPPKPDSSAARKCEPKNVRDRSRASWLTTAERVRHPPHPDRAPRRTIAPPDSSDLRQRPRGEEA